MKPKLPRALLWTDKTSMDDFLRESINMELYNFYMLQRKQTPYYLRNNPIKIFNEIYYQLTKIEYESVFDISFKELKQDIKANLGLWQTGVLVFNMMHVFLYLIDRKSTTLRLFEKNLKEYIADYNGGETVFAFEKELKHSFTTHLYPHPCDVKELNSMLLPWDDITNDFNRESIEEIIKLWPSKEDKNEVLHMIEYAFIRRSCLLTKDQNLPAHTTLTADKNFFSNMYDSLGFNDFHAKFSTEEISSHNPSYADIEEENYNLKKKIAHLESENERLRSERNPLKQRKNRDRAFTLKMIVDYCKKHLNLDKAAVIVAMLNKFLRDARDYTQEECELVDSVEIEYLNKKYGDTVMGDKNVFRDSSGLNRITLPEGMTPQQAIKLLQNQIEEDGEEG